MTDPWPDAPPDSRLAAVSRRAFLQRSTGLIGVVAFGGLAACGASDDAQAFKSSPSAATTATTTAGAANSTASSATSVPSTDTNSLPGSAQLAVAFTYAPTASGGRVNNPYIAVWIEDASSALVKALAVWYKTGKDAHYLSELTAWTDTDGSSSALSTVSGATRTPGDYSLLWDGTDLDGKRVATGDYFVAIESAREHGPHSLIRQSLSLADQPFTTNLSSNGELTGAAADYRIA
jgi:hypothetical protein